MDIIQIKFHKLLFHKYIQNTLKLRDEKINFIVNIDNMKQSKAELFFDNDEVDSIDNNFVVACLAGNL